MAIFNWSEEVTLGIKQIERQHQNLLSLINDLRNMADNSVRSEELISSLIEFTRSVEEHFDYEEDILGITGYIKSEQHRKEHDSILQKLNEIAKSAVEHEQSAMKEALVNVFNWFEQHLTEEDTEYLRYLKDGVSDTSY